MTNEQVIKRINEIREILADYRALTSYDHEALDIAISALRKQSASSGKVDYKAQVKILADVLDGCPLYTPCDTMAGSSGWCKDHCKDGQDSPDAECWMRYARLNAIKQARERGELFIGQNVLNDVLGQSAENDEDKTTDDHIADSDKMIKLEKRTITERLIIAESLIYSVIADSDQFREVTKMTDDVPDFRVGKTDFKPGDKFILELGTERRMFKEFEIAGTDLYVKTD